MAYKSKPETSPVTTAAIKITAMVSISSKNPKMIIIIPINFSHSIKSLLQLYDSFLLSKNNEFSDFLNEKTWR